MTAVETNSTETPDARPRNVIEALAAVRRDLPGIGKNMEASQQQGGYAYRGIEDITAAVGPLLGKYYVVFVPRVIEERTVGLTINNKPWTDTRLKIEYTVYGPGGIQDHIVIGPLLTIGRDNSDKGSTKCMSQAFKVALLQVLCIGDLKADADGTTHEADARPGPDQHAQSLGWASADEMKAEHDDYLAAGRALSDVQKAEAKARKAYLGIGWPMSRTEMEIMANVLVELEVADAKEHVADSEQHVTQLVSVAERFERLTPRLKATATQRANQAGLPRAKESMQLEEHDAWLVLLDKLEESTKPFTEDDETLNRVGQ